MKYKLRDLIFITLCCDLGLFSKRLIAPAANIITDFIRIPGGIGTSFSLMFLIIGASIVQIPGCAVLMAVIQSLTALSLGMVGSMGALSPIGYIVPGIIIDVVFYLFQKAGLPKQATMVTANMLSGAAAGLTANLIVFRLTGIPLALYVTVALASGALCGTLAHSLVVRLRPVLSQEDENAEKSYSRNNRSVSDRSRSTGIYEQERSRGQAGPSDQIRRKRDPRRVGGYHF